MTVEQAFEQKVSDVPVTIQGRVTKILTDDTGDTPHQRFIVEVHSGHTILIAHNLQRAYRVPINLSDRIEVHGSYVWNKYGGILHNTHHYAGECVGSKCTPHEDGWINYAGQKIETLSSP